MSKLAVALVVVALPAVAAVPVVERGAFLFRHAWTPFDPEARGGDGVGPVYNASSCVECHNQGGPGGAGAQNVISVGGAVRHVHGSSLRPPRVEDDERFPSPSTTVVRVVSSDAAEADLTRVAAALTTRREALGFCLEREPDFSIRRADIDIFARVSFTLDDAGARDLVVLDASTTSMNLDACLARELKELSSPLAHPIAVAADITLVTPHPPQKPMTPSTVTSRNTPALFGDGLIDAIPDDVIEAGADTSIADYPEIHGVVGRTREGRVARFGWKDDTPDLFTFVSRACANEVGLEVPGVPQPGMKRSPGYDLDLDDVVALTGFVRSLPRPIEAERAPFASEGAELFEQIGCTACHEESLGDVDGIFSDLLLHDMGSLLDDVNNGGSYGAAPSTATSRMWRTTPLWGVRDSGPWLHDGRAKTLQQAIEVHFGEASRARERFVSLNEDERNAVVAFLESLQAPPSLANATP